MYIMIVRNIAATTVGIVVINLITIAYTFVLELIFPGVYVSPGDSSPFIIKVAVTINVILSSLAAFTTGYITAQVTADDTVEWTFPTIMVTVISVTNELKNLLDFLINGFPVDLPYWYHFIEILILLILIPAGGFFAHSD